MCDTLCVVRPGTTLFAKNSDRPPSEVQLIESHSAREPGGTLRTTHIEMPDSGAYAVLGSRPEWMWGFEHGVNEHRVAIGNEKVFTTLDPNKQPPGLTGMDLVRLGLERGRTADEALEAMTALLAEHGQGGVCDKTTGESYFSSFIIASPGSGWILETSGRTWVAAPVTGSAAISNRLTLRTEWTRSSRDVPPGADWDAWRHPNAPTGHADVRLAASHTCLAAAQPSVTSLAAHLRSHGREPSVPERFAPDGDGVTVCMHLRGFQNTTSSMIAELRADPAAPLRAWVAPGQPCVSVYLPVFPPHAVPDALSDPAAWHAFALLRDRVEREVPALREVRALLDPIEADTWREAQAVDDDPERQRAFVESAWKRVEDAVGSLLQGMSVAT
jgi:secernin